jgi:hypothetical protein
MDTNAQDGDDDRTSQHDDDPSSDRDRVPLRTTVWRYTRPVIEVGGLISAFKHNEGAALTAQALVVIGDMIAR